MSSVGLCCLTTCAGRAELIIDVESTSGGKLIKNENHPYLHLLMPLRKDAGGGGEGGAAAVAADQAKM